MADTEKDTLVIETPVRHRYKKEYIAWLNMKSRCDNPRNKSYKYYGGRGITYCTEFSVFKSFLQLVGTAPDKEFSLERVDVSKGYTPDNVVWACLQDQAENKTSTIYVSYRGKKVRLLGVARENDVPRSYLHYRVVQLGMSVEDALENAKAAKSGEDKWVGEVSKQCYRARKRAGWTEHDARHLPKHSRVTYTGNKYYKRPEKISARAERRVLMKALRKKAPVLEGPMEKI